MSDKGCKCLYRLAKDMYCDGCVEPRIATRQLWGSYEAAMRHLWSSYEAAMRHLWGTYEAAMRQIWGSYEAAMRQLWGSYEVAIRHLWGSYACLVSGFARHRYTNTMRLIRHNFYRQATQSHVDLLILYVGVSCAGFLFIAKPMGGGGIKRCLLSPWWKICPKHYCRQLLSLYVRTHFLPGPRRHLPLRSSTRGLKVQ